MNLERYEEKIISHIKNQGEDHPFYEIQGTNANPWTPLNLKCHDVDSSHMIVIGSLSSVGLHQSFICNTLNSAKTHEDQVFVISMQIMFDPI